MRAAEDARDEDHPAPSGARRVVLELVHDDAVALGRKRDGPGDGSERRAEPLPVPQIFSELGKPSCKVVTSYQVTVAA